MKCDVEHTKVCTVELCSAIATVLWYNFPRTPGTLKVMPSAVRMQRSVCVPLCVVSAVMSYVIVD